MKIAILTILVKVYSLVLPIATFKKNERAQKHI
jgi:hypothetical protein